MPRLDGQIFFSLFLYRSLFHFFYFSFSPLSLSFYPSVATTAHNEAIKGSKLEIHFHSHQHHLSHPSVQQNKFIYLFLAGFGRNDLELLPPDPPRRRIIRRQRINNQRNTNSVR